MEKLPEPRELPSRVWSPVRKAKQALQEGRDALVNRLGWPTVQNTVGNLLRSTQLADGTDDEKRIRKAEKEAEKKIAEKRKAAASKNKRSFRQMAPRSTNRPLGVSTQPYYEPRPPFRPSDGGAGLRARMPRNGPIGPCHNCHEYGHLK